MKTQHRAKLAHIHAACFTIPRPWTAQEFHDLLEKPTVFCIEKEYGFAIGQHLDMQHLAEGRLDGSYLDGNHPNIQQTELLTLAIIPEQQGKGYGRDLLNLFIKRARSLSVQHIFLEVAENNKSALGLYIMAGFYKIGFRTDYYKVPDAPPINAVLMRLDITE